MRKRFRIGLGILAIASFLVTGLNVNALERYAFRSDTYYITPEELWQEEQRALREEWFNREPETNNITNWPTGPLVHARSAIVMEVDTGVVLYSKSGTEVLYPASITKLLTLLVALDYSELTEQIEFTETSMSMVRWDYAHIAMQLGEVISMEDGLFALMLASANEVAVALAKTVGDIVDGGGYETFIRLMNERSKEIGTTSSSWSNPTGLHGYDHYTTAYDMALITSYLYQYPQYHTFMSELSHEIGYTNLVEEVRTLWQDHQMLHNPINDFYNTFANGGKTGFTNQAGTTLVTTGNNGEFSIVVVLMDAHGWEAYNATNVLFDYAFNNFSKIYLNDNVLDQHVVELLEIDKYIMLPALSTFDQVNREIIITDERNNQGIARYFYDEHLIGQVRVLLSDMYFEYLEELIALEIQQAALEAEQATREIDGEADAGRRVMNVIFVILAVIVVVLVIGSALMVQQVRIKRELIRRNKKERRRV